MRLICGNFAGNNQRGFTPIWILLGVLVLGMGIGVLMFKQNQEQVAIANFAQCVAVGNPVMESYPRQCVTEDGRSFTEKLSEEEMAKVRSPEESSSGAAFYTACGCGCCGGTIPTEQCLNKSKGESIETVKAEDQKMANSENCEVTGCSVGTKYKYCN